MTQDHSCFDVNYFGWGHIMTSMK